MSCLTRIFFGNLNKVLISPMPKSENQDAGYKLIFDKRIRLARLI